MSQFVFFIKYYNDVEIKKDKMGGACSIAGRSQVQIQH
jgi:hypothetical protein